MTDLAVLTVKLEAEVSQYQQQLAAATKQLQDFQDRVAGFAEEVAGKFAAAFTIDKIAEFVESSIESAAALEKLSQESGVAVEQLSALQAVFAQSGVGQDEMASSLKKLNQAVSEASGNASSKAAFAFQALGISVTNANGSLKTAGQLLPEIAEAYSHLADGPNKVAINIDLLGRSANALIPTLNKGSQGLNDLQAAAIASGAALSKDLAEAAEELETKFNALKQSATGTLQTDVLKASLPTLNAFADGLALIAKVASDSSGIFAAFTNVVLKPLGTVLLSLDVGLRDTGAEFSALADSVADAAHGKFAQAWKDLQDGAHNVVAINTAGKDALVKLWESGGNSVADIADETATIVEKRFKEAMASLNSPETQGVAPELGKQLDDAKKKVEDFAASIKTQVDSFNKGAAAQTALKLSTGALGDAVALAQRSYDDLVAKGINPYTDSAIKSAKATLDAAHAAQTLSVQQQAQIDTREIQSYIDKLTEQTDKIDLGTVAATKYAETHGKLGLALKDSAINGAEFTKQIDDLTVKLVQASNAKTLADLSVQALELQGRLVDAANAAFELQSKLPRANAASVNDVALQNQIDQTHALTVAQKAYQELVNQTASIRAAEAVTESAINAQIASGQIDQLSGQAKIADARTAELAQLTDIGDKMQSIANNTGLPSLVLQSQQAKAALNDLAINAVDPLTKKLRDDFESSASDAFASFVTGAESASQAAHQFLTSFETELLKLAANKTLEDLFGATGQGGGGGIFGALAGFLGGGSGNGLSAAQNASIAATGSGAADDSLALLAGGGLASGGPAMPGHSYTVGEHGAEEFVPDVPGTIVPNSKMQKGGNVYVSVSIAAPQGTVSRQTAAQTAQAVGSGVARAQRRNG